MKLCNILLVFSLTCHLAFQGLTAEARKDLGMQLAENPPMQTISRTPPPPVTMGAFDVRKGFKLIRTLDEFRTDRCNPIFIFNFLFCINGFVLGNEATTIR